MDLEGVSAIVTGAASGLGAATARALAAQGAVVVVADMQAELGEQVAGEVGGTFRRTDVTSESDAAAAVAAASALGPLRVLVNCAGVGAARRTVSRSGTPHPLEEFRRVLEINLVGTFNCLRLAAAAMQRLEPLPGGERGTVLNTASIAAFDGQIGQAAYAASKGGIVGLTLAVARDLAEAGIRVNTIAPGLIDTPIYGAGEAAAEFKATLGGDLLFPHRFGTGTEFAQMALACITNTYLNGATVRLDGGARLGPA